MEIKFVDNKKIEPASALIIFKTETIYINKNFPKLIQKFLIEHEKVHLKDYKRLERLGRTESLFWCELKAYVYAFFKQPFGGFFGIIRNLYPPRLISFIKFYFFDNKKKIINIEKKLR